MSMLHFQIHFILVETHSFLISQSPFLHAIAFQPIFSLLLYSFCVSYHLASFFLVKLTSFQFLYLYLFPCKYQCLMIRRYETEHVAVVFVSHFLKCSYVHSLCRTEFHSCVYFTLSLPILVSPMLIPFNGYCH